MKESDVATKKKEAGEAGRRTERINVWLLPEQVEWLKAKGNVSENVRAMVTEAISLDRLKQSVRGAADRVPKASGPPRSPRSRKGGSTRSKAR